MKRTSRELRIALAAAGVGATLVAVVSFALAPGKTPRSAATGVESHEVAPRGRDSELRSPEADPSDPVRGTADARGHVAPASPRGDLAAGPHAPRMNVGPANGSTAAASEMLPPAQRESHEMLADGIVASLGWPQEPEDTLHLGRWLQRSAEERAAVLNGYMQGQDRAHAYNRVLEAHLAELRSTFGNLRAGQVVERLRLSGMDPETGELYSVDVEGKALDGGRR